MLLRASLSTPQERGKPLADENSTPEEAPKKKGPHDPDQINPKLTSDIHYWSEELNVTGQQLHEAIRVHGTHVKKIREALKHGKH